MQCNLAKPWVCIPLTCLITYQGQVEMDMISEQPNWSHSFISSMIDIYFSIPFVYAPVIPHLHISDPYMLSPHPSIQKTKTKEEGNKTPIPSKNAAVTRLGPILGTARFKKPITHIFHLPFPSHPIPSSSSFPALQNKQK